MTYLQLKELPLCDLLKLIENTAKTCNDLPLIKDITSRDREMAAPTLCMIGDFEIRARFLDHRTEELERKPEHA